MTKYDFLVTEVQDKIVQTIQLLQEYNEIDPSLSLREVYEKYFHPSVLPIDDSETWEAIQNNEVLNVFQFDSDVGAQAAQKIRPSNMMELSDSNGLMRLMTAEKGQETPMEKYIRFKNNINLWYKEMEQAGLTGEEQRALEPYFKQSYGVPPSQEQLMQMLMDDKICHFTLAEANTARKIVGKKQMSKIPELKEKVLAQAASPQLGQYVWKNGVGPQMGYSFSIIHALAYSFIGFQTAYIATRWNPIFWNTACLIVNSAALDENREDDDEDDNDNTLVFDDDDDDVDKSTDYAKLAKAIGEITMRGINVSLVDINKSEFTFKPDVENNTILFGMKAVSKIGADVINEIKARRPYKSFKDFLNKTNFNKTVMVSLIKAGAFDKLEEEWAKELKIEPRYLIMAYYAYLISDRKSRLTLQNYSTLLSHGLIGDEFDFEKRVYNFNKYLKLFKMREYYKLDAKSYEFFNNNFDADDIEMIENIPCINQKRWDKIYTSVMENLRTWLKKEQQSVLETLNQMIVQETWDKYAKGSISYWEMESLCFYYHEHELAKTDLKKYNLVDYNSLPRIPKVEIFYRGKYPIYKLYNIIGTVLCKNNTKHSVTLLTTTGVVTVKFTKEYYAMFNRQISEFDPSDGRKHVKEKGWFVRGTKLMITGYRREDMFIAKRYSATPTHQLYKITDIDKNGNLTMTHERYQEVNE